MFSIVFNKKATSIVICHYKDVGKSGPSSGFEDEGIIEAKRGVSLNISQNLKNNCIIKPLWFCECNKALK